MKSRLLLALVLLALCISSVLAGPREAEWEAVEQAIRDRLPKTAIEKLDPIIAAALADKSYAEAIRAIAKKIDLEAGAEGDSIEGRMLRLEHSMNKMPPEIRPLTEAILAHSYWDYYRRNRWRFLQRTQTAASPGPDIATWDLARILGEIEKHFDAALENEGFLKGVSISDYEEFLTRGNVLDAYRPTLYDFIVYEALKFHQSGEQGPVAAEDGFEIPADSPIFDSVDEFLTWQPETTDRQAPAVKIVRLYQNLLRFHQTDVDRSAYLDADLSRLVWGSNIAGGENKTARYKVALQRLASAAGGHEVAGRALAALAGQLEAEGELAQAHAIAERVAAEYPGTMGGASALNLIQRLETKSVYLETESVWSGSENYIAVNYCNVRHLYFRAVPIDYIDLLKTGGESDLKDRLLSQRPLLEWRADLPPGAPFKSRTEKIPAPRSLKPGFYGIVASEDPSFSRTDNSLSYTTVWVSKLALVLDLRPGRPLSGFVLHADLGSPLENATVRIWKRDGSTASEIQTLKTDKNGRFEFAVKLGPELSDVFRRSGVVTAEWGSETVSNCHPTSLVSPQENERPFEAVVFFTDRSIYRPGQMIQFKGLAMSVDRERGEYAPLAGRATTVAFYDTKHLEIARTECRTNEYGSFSGTFTAPRDRLAGEMSIETANPVGRAEFNVEEYKKPKFHVVLDAPAEAPKLGAKVALRGKATAYTGAAVSGAKVKWRVTREARAPVWCWWWRPVPEKAIAHGVANTDLDGTFNIEFAAEPDRTVAEDNEPLFRFSVQTDITDLSGETRSGERVLGVGYTALQAVLIAEEWQTSGNPVELSISTSALDGTPQAASGTVRIHSLRQPTTVPRSPLQGERNFHNSWQEPGNASDPRTWELDREVQKKDFQTDGAGKARIASALPVGVYRAILETKDRFGRKVTAQTTIQVIDPSAKRYPIKLPNYIAAPKWTLEPGNDFAAVWGTGYEAGRAWIELICNGRVLKQYWTRPSRTQEQIRLHVTEEMRGGLTLRVVFVRENRAYLVERTVQVPWTNKELSLKWERFRSKLLPGQKETWALHIAAADNAGAAAELTAALYDAALDQYGPNQWHSLRKIFRIEDGSGGYSFENIGNRFRWVSSWKATPSQTFFWNYRAFQDGLLNNLWNWIPLKTTTLQGTEIRVNDAGEEVIVLSPFEVVTETTGYYQANSMAGTRLMTRLEMADFAMGGINSESFEEGKKKESAEPPPTDLSQVVARKNLNETAFFFPHLTTDEKGVVRMTFTMPEALTEWKFLGFAHDKQLRAGLLTDKVTTSKDLMVEPNPPRFVREGDTVEFTVKVSNQSDLPQKGAVKLTFADAASLKSIDDALSNRTPEQAFDVPAKQSRSYSWRIAVPDGLGFMTYKAVGATAQFSDGEEGFLPVLSRRILVTESLPLPIRGKSTKNFDFEKLLASGKSDTLRHQSFTVQMTSQPEWYAVMALPYLMEFPHECSEQLFNRFYSNALARHIANSDPKIRRVFDLWKATPTLDGPLEKNNDLKSLMVEETPWWREATAESQARRNLGLLFDRNRLDEETSRALKQLAERQQSDGLWAWFPDGCSSEYISRYIVTGFGRLRHLGAQIDVAPAVKALAALDAALAEDYRNILKRDHPEDYVPSHMDALTLYGRSFFLKDRPIAKLHQPAVDFFLGQARKFWLKSEDRQRQAHLALALQRFGETKTPRAIMKSLKERSLNTEELGMHWQDAEAGWWWYQAPIETQALMIEAFAEVANDAQAVEDCKVWLLKQKQTQNWKTTKATADAVYGLLLCGDNLLASDALVEVSLGGEAIRPEKVEVGTGFYEQKFVRSEIKPSMGAVTVRKTDDGVSWGSVHWQYLEDIAKVTPHEGTPLKLKKTLWIKETTSKGQVLKPVKGPVAVGDELVVRIELRVDRDMEYVHMKDQRGSGTEPVNVLSRYKYQDGLAYYESTRDTASHFFIDYLPKGTYVFEYSTRVQLKGNYQTGIAEIQCMYAPEFNSHSESIPIEVK